MLKKSIRDILTSDIVTITPDEPAARAVELMAHHHVSCIPVLDHGRVIGIFTERDIVANAAKHGPGFSMRAMREVMSAPVVTIGDEAQVYEAYSLLNQHKIRHLVAVDATGATAGVVTLTDLQARIGYEEFFEFKKVSQVMTTETIRVAHGTSLRECVLRLHETHSRCLVMAAGPKPVGMVTERDIARAIARSCSLDDDSVEKIMTSPVLAISPDSSISEAAILMRQHKVRRLAVTEAEGELLGVVTLSDIVDTLERGYIEMLRSVIRNKEQDLGQIMDRLTEKTMYLDSILSFSLGMGIAATDANQRIAFVNGDMANLFGARPEDLLGMSLLDLHGRHHVESERVDRALKKARKGGRHTFAFTHANGNEPRYLEAELASIPGMGSGADPEQGGYLLMVRDISDRKRAEDKIMHMALHDALTGLPNRYLFMEHFESEVSRARRSGRSFALLLIDLDNFKDINDRHGHSAGDAILREFALRLRGVMREYDMAARFGGDEFIVLVADHHGHGDVARMSERILAHLERPIEACGKMLSVGASIGASVYPDDGSEFKDLCCKADKAMYQAKRLGRGNGRSHFALYPGVHPEAPPFVIPVRPLANGEAADEVGNSI